MTPHLRFHRDDGAPGDVIDLSQWRLNELPDENSDEDWDDDRELIDPSGRLVETWREGYPYPERMQRREYEIEKRRLQIELLKLQGWVKETGQKVLLVFEGRDAAGKGGTIKRFTEHLNPRGARVVALDKPSDRERTQWYFQRYVQHLPAAGEIVMFDRSWYNRAGVERVMGYCTPGEYEEFMRQAPEFERMLVHSDIHLVKLWFSVSRGEQRSRFIVRQIDPVRQWKLSPTDLASLDRWHDYTIAKEAMFASHRHRACPVDGDQEQRQEAGPAGGHAACAVPAGLHGPARGRRRAPRPADRRLRRRRAGRRRGRTRTRCCPLQRSARDRREPLVSADGHGPMAWRRLLCGLRLAHAPPFLGRDRRRDVTCTGHAGAHGWPFRHAP